jgi:hypothetical protein
VPYLEDGMFMLCFFNAYKLLSKENISEELKLENYYIRPNDNFPNPLIDACFLDMNFKSNNKGSPVKERVIDEKMLINVFLSHENQISCFIYDRKENEKISKLIKIKLMDKLI